MVKNLVDLSVDLKGIRFANPVAMASGNAGYGFEYQAVSGFPIGMWGRLSQRHYLGAEAR